MTYLDQKGGHLYGQGQKDKQGLSRPGMAGCHVFPYSDTLKGTRQGEQMVRYYGHYSNFSRGKRQKEGSDDAIPCILELQGDVKAFRKSWARLIQKIYEVNLLICPRCKGTMRIISAIDDRQVIRAILEHLGLWLVRSRPPLCLCVARRQAKAYASPIREYATVGLQLQTHADTIYGDPEYSLVPFRVWDEYIYPDTLKGTRRHKQS